MSYATQDQVLNYLQGGQQGQTAGVDPTSSKSMGSSGGSGVVGGGYAGAAPQKSSGGQGLWTNIQSYVGANQAGQQQRADAVKGDVQGTLGQEKQAFDTKTQEAKSSAEKAAAPINSVNKDAASQMIAQASSADKGSDAYKNNIDPLKTAVNTQYQAPSAFSYGMSANAQQLGDVQDQGKFKNFLSQFDRKLQGGRELNVGQKALQNQLDTQNEGLETARQGLANEYGNLSSGIESGQAETNKGLTDLANKTRTNQSDLISYLTGEGASSLKNIDNAVSSHNQAVDTNAANNQNYLNQLGSTASAFTQSRAGRTPQNTGPFTIGDGRGEERMKMIDNMTADQAKSVDVNSTDTNTLGGMYNRYKTIESSGKRLPDDAKAFLAYVDKVKKTPTYQAGARADQTNVGGVHGDRAKYNALMDIFNKQGIAEAPEVANSVYKDNIKWGS